MTSAYTKENVAILRDFMKRSLRDEKGVVPVLTSTLKEVFDYIESLEQDAKHLHVKLAGETLRADQGWERYEAANKSRNALEAAMVAQQDKGKETV